MPEMLAVYIVSMVLVVGVCITGIVLIYRHHEGHDLALTTAWSQAVAMLETQSKAATQDRDTWSRERHTLYTAVTTLANQMNAESQAKQQAMTDMLRRLQTDVVAAVGGATHEALQLVRKNGDTEATARRSS
jgi:flagellar motor switch/type III secretory pathway protein FliN